MKIGKTLLSAFLVLLLAVFIAYAQEDTVKSFKFKDADVRLVMEAIAQKAFREGKKINIIISPEVQGLVSLDLESVDWETALGVILKTSGYGQIRYRDVIIIAPYEKIQEMESKGQDRIETRVFHLKYLDSNDAKKAVTSLLSGSGRISVLEFTGQTGWKFTTSTTGVGGVERGVLSRSSVLVVSDNVKKLDEISSFLAQIDVMPKQVVIKARIMEVDRNLLRDIGVEFATGASGAESSTIVTTPTGKSNGVDLTQLGLHALSSTTPSSFTPLSEGLTADNAGLKLVFKKLTGNQFEVILHALEEDTRTNILSAPVILTLNNQEATILVGTKFPIIQSDVSTETNTIIGASLESYQDIGISLRVLPQIWGPNDEFINMVIHPSVSSSTQTVKVTTQSGATLVEYPIIESREAETQVALKDGETIVMGGLLKDTKTRQEIGIPFLKDIPWLGHLFKRYTYNTAKIDLLIFITAKVVKPGENVPVEVINTAKVEEIFQKNKLEKNVP
ncbi:MAG: hypothetical protein PHU91_04925 [Candidatus Omnitrophica bacterium]|nr:hypothetical protein [Candidatus Omnitrophota bacterium]MDD5236986.1 hypothetical protein [Candidatus Omnitrophota bacterium]MDD5611249.1 hypothetical protein [Candidatus Omnitrophota bacterium]